MIKNINIKVKKILKGFEDIPLPSYATTHSSGMDVRAAVEKDVTLASGNFILIPTNLAVEIPEGYEIQVRPRSGLALKHGIGVLNSPGTIDADYRGEIKILLFNFGKENIIIKRGDRIAQLVVSKVQRAELIESAKVNKTIRGSGGFGHTGKT